MPCTEHAHRRAKGECCVRPADACPDREKFVCLQMSVETYYSQTEYTVDYNSCKASPPAAFRFTR